MPTYFHKIIADCHICTDSCILYCKIPQIEAVKLNQYQIVWPI